MTLLIAEAFEFSSAALAQLRERMIVRTADLSRAELLAAVHDVEVLWVRVRSRIDREVMEAAPALKIVVTNTTGLDHIDLAEARRRDIRVLSLRGETAFLDTVPATAELTVALLLALVRHVPSAVRHVQQGGWDRYGFKGHDLRGRTVGVIGYGRLGRMVGRLLDAFGMHVLAATKEPTDRTDGGVRFLELASLLERADVVTLHVNLSDETRQMFGQAEFDRMKRGAWFINTARGELVCEQALVRALASGHLAGAALDVAADLYERSSPSPVLEYAATHDNLIMTPHIGGYTVESLEKTEMFLAAKLLTLLEPAVVEGRP